MPSLFSSVRTRGTGAAMLWRVTFASGHSIHTRHGYSIYPNQLCYISATTACRNMSRGFASILITSINRQVLFTLRPQSLLLLRIYAKQPRRYDVATPFAISRQHHRVLVITNVKYCTLPLGITTVPVRSHTGTLFCASGKRCTVWWLIKDHDLRKGERTTVLYKHSVVQTHSDYIMVAQVQR